MKKTFDTNQLNGSSLTENAKQVIRSTASAVQDKVQSGIAKTQDVLFTGLDATQDTLKSAQKAANKNLKKARKNMRGLQGNLQDKAQAGLSVLQMPFSLA